MTLVIATITTISVIVGTTHSLVYAVIRFTAGIM